MAAILERNNDTPYVTLCSSTDSYAYIHILTSINVLRLYIELESLCG